MVTKNKILLAHLALFGANLIYAFNYGYAKDVMDGGYVPPFTFILFRAVGATFLFWVTSIFSMKTSKEMIFGALFFVDFLGNCKPTYVFCRARYDFNHSRLHHYD